MYLVSIAISTISNRIEKLDLIPYEGVQYIIIHQDSHLATFEFLNMLIKRLDVVYVPLERKGLSASRNAALANSNTDYIMIMDDDVTFSIDAIYNILGEMKKDKVDVATYYHKYTDGNSTLKYKKAFFHNKFNIANPSSIDICINRESVLKAAVNFDESFGLGSKYPSGEEMIFLSDCLKSGLKVKRYPLEICVHPPIASGADFFTTAQKTLAKAAMFKRVYPKSGSLFFILFMIRKWPMAFRAGYGCTFISNALRIILISNNR